MPGESSISWTTSTWNPVTGCDKISPGCAHCYAETFAERWRGTPGHAYEQGFDLRLWPGRLEVPLSWRRPRRIFVNSMSDLFHEDIPAEFIARVFDTMRRADHHVFQVLTKRPERIAEHLPADWGEGYPNVWLGVTIENRRFVGRADVLCSVPAAVRFISAEPLLGPLMAPRGAMYLFDGNRVWSTDADPTGAYVGPELLLDGIDWIIIGGESGPGCRRFDEQWARAIITEAASVGTAVHVKQMGTLWARAHGVKGKAENPDEWPPDLRIREWPRVREVA